MIIENIKQNAFKAAKNKEETKKNILRFVLGEVQTAEIKQNKSFSDDEVISIIRKIVVKNNETLSFIKDDKNAELKSKLELENNILDEYIPEALSVEKIIKALDEEVSLLVKDSKSDGQAMGIMMKFFKQSDYNVLGKDVKEAVSKIRETV